MSAPKAGMGVGEVGSLTGKSKDFKGELKQPIKWDGPDLSAPRGLLDSAEPSQEETEQTNRAISAAIQRVVDRKWEKIQLLKKHYGLRTDSTDRALLLRLAEDFVPGFKVDYERKKTGRPTKWDSSRLMELLADVEKLKRKEGIGDHQACRLLVRRRSQYGNRYPDGTGVKALQNSLGHARDPNHNPFYKLIANASTSEEEEYLTQQMIDLFAL